MNDQERITQLETMLTEERAKVSYVLGVFESYARGLDMIARTIYAETPAGSRDEKNAMTMKQHTIDILGWLEIKAAELRGMMGRAMPAGQVDMTESEATATLDGLPFPFGPVANEPPEAPEPPAPVEEAEQPQAVTIH